jgi:hypothetical protein
MALVTEASPSLTGHKRVARRSDSIAMKKNPPKAAVKYRCCCRLLGEWAVPEPTPTHENLIEDAFQWFQSTLARSFTPAFITPTPYFTEIQQSDANPQWKCVL